MENKVISAIYNYYERQSSCDEAKDTAAPIDFTGVLLAENSIFNYKQPFFSCFCHFLAENKHIMEFTNRWAHNVNYPRKNQLNDFTKNCDKIELLLNLIQGVTSNIIYPKEMPLKNIERENTLFAVKILKMINTGEKCISNLLQREKFLVPKGGVVSFDKLVGLIRISEPMLIYNQIALYSRLNAIIEEFGTAQIKSEFKEIMKELHIWVKKELGVG